MKGCIMKNKNYICFSKLPDELINENIVTNIKLPIICEDNTYYYFFFNKKEYKIEKEQEEQKEYFYIGDIIRKDH